MIERIICSAVWFKSSDVKYVHQPKNIDKGYVVSGRRHHNCFTLHFILTGRLLKGAEHEEGFITDTDRFVGREEAMAIAKKCGQVTSQQSLRDKLYSEDLY